MASGRGTIGCVAACVAALFAMAAANASAATGPCSAPVGRPWCNPALSPDERAWLLVHTLTTDEKISLLAGAADAKGHTGGTAAIPRVGLPQSYVTDGPVGVRQGSATAMPTPMADAAAFDPAIAHLYGEVLGNEARAKANDGILAPTINMMRTPLNGRTFEAFGEDPFLVANTAAAWIEGAQSQGVFATPKHFAGNNQEGYDLTGHGGDPGSAVGGGQYNTRYFTNSMVDERTLHEIYLPQFEAAVKAGAGSVMCSYNKINGPWACANHRLLDDILRKQWGFKGLLMSDWILATHLWETSQGLNAGLDLEMPVADEYTPQLVQSALATGQTTEAMVDEHVERLLRTLFAVGFFDRATAMPDDSLIDKKAHAAAAERVEEDAITLLRNNGVLPLDAAQLHSIAVIGPDADKFVTGGGSGNVSPFTAVTALAGIKSRAGSSVKVSYNDGSDAGAAAAAAKAADVAIVVVGDDETEGADRQCLTLECPDSNGDQDGLIESVAAAQPKTIVVLETGGPVLTPWRDRLAALVEAWYPGEAGGTAIARMLFGDIDAGGRLPVTFPKSEADEQVAGNQAKYPGDPQGNVHYDEGVLIGYRWFDAMNLTPAYPFGFGLSYTSWKYGPLTVTPAADASGATISFIVKNTGSRAGSDVAQLYLGLPSPGPGIVQPPRQLKGYRKVALGPGGRKRVTFAVGPRDLSYWNVNTQGWRVARGCYGVMVGRSSRDIVRHATLAAGGAYCPGAAVVVKGVKTRCHRTRSHGHRGHARRRSAACRRR
jgi:beta-glucosidase